MYQVHATSATVLLAQSPFSVLQLCCPLPMGEREVLVRGQMEGMVVVPKGSSWLEIQGDDSSTLRDAGKAHSPLSRHCSVTLLLLH